MGAHVTRTDFEWSTSDEPHASRRKEILEKYPQIKKLFGSDPNFKWIVSLMITLQIAMIFVVPRFPWPLVIGLAYCFGGVINHSLMLAIHEISHNLAFGHARPMANRVLGMIANLPIGIPFSVSFKKYHLEHHRYQGDEILDTDIPTTLEAKLFCTTVGKVVWMFLQPLFYALRPLFVRPLPPSMTEIINVVIQLSFDFAVYYFLGAKALVYLLAGSLLAMGIHPVAGHFISEHYMFAKGFETYSYYGPLNWITFNVGYHNEHHDFPAVPGSRLPQVKAIAPEYYENLPHHNSWVKVLYDFIMDPAIGPYARVKRRNQSKVLKEE
ncbi:sphingolipid delta(4)-desaturase DES1 [Daphnia magna]|uniref:sphingolipid delta(4)-desaturase DES1 n=1 Tax=Daphnia magna TaxID=35525 RepID=UPI001E1BC6A4|nr:sphingolipid delta(4)-desaturase DES1 [Daphnia magna]XP_045034225.1 sphingolipid delta(4)-desaturase DES1 [Daphnia magna]XP_045034226.1 sphingolipid delta(4)-desaturase DES1 [Daphnia magna]UTO68478.1 fatty acid desaturase [Daphnia magna]